MDPAAAVADMDDLVEEVLLRSPPDDPAHLVRAALVCKRWCRILADAGFRRRFRELHRTAPMLGILHRHARASHVTTFTATSSSSSSFRPRNGGDLLLRDWCALDSRHGRVLLAGLPLRDNPSENSLSVWDPITGERLELPGQPQHPELVPFGWNATVLCPDRACDHLDCGRGPFLVVVVGTDLQGQGALLRMPTHRRLACGGIRPMPLITVATLSISIALSPVPMWRMPSTSRFTGEWKLESSSTIWEHMEFPMISYHIIWIEVCSRLQRMVGWDLLQWIGQYSVCGRGRLVAMDIRSGHKAEPSGLIRCSLLILPSAHLV